MSLATDKNNQVLKEIINNSWSGIGIMNFDSSFIFTNEAFKPILGYTKEELQGVKFSDLILPKYQNEFSNLLESHKINEYINNMLVGCIRKDQQLVYLDISIKQMRNQKFIVININDVTKNISDHEIYDRYVIQLHTDTEGKINEVSEAFCKLSLFEESELLGNSYQFLIDEEQNNSGLFEKGVAEFKKNGQFTGVITIRNKQQERLYVDVIIKAIKNKYGDTTGYSAVMFDITNQIKLQKNTEVLEETIVDNLEKLKIMSQTMRTVAHEWRQPLNAISLDAQNLLVSYQLMGESVKGEEAIPILKGVQESIQELSNVISQFQYITEFQEDFVEVSLHEVVQKAFDFAIIDKKILQYEKADFNIVTCKDALSKSLVSILNNAQEAIDRVKPKDAFISVMLKEDITSYYIVISNNGGGIAQDVLPNIFNPYFSTKEQKNGVGLSLYIAKMILEFHLKGKISAKNIDDTIVEFTVKIPKKDVKR
jgi:two-component system, NtrC family, sensor kinase